MVNILPEAEVEEVCSRYTKSLKQGVYLLQTSID